MHNSLYHNLDLDGAWPKDALPEGHYVDLRRWGDRLRYCAPGRLIERFYKEAKPYVGHFNLVGSGDFHHLTALWLRQMEAPFTLVSFDNHPDWDTRPPFWCCGTWINRAFRSPLLEKAAVWGCANFELNAPHRWFANKGALRSKRLEVWPWRERFSPSAQARFGGIRASDWQEQFESFADQLRGRNLYVTIDLDCLRPEDASTDWEQGLFSVEQVVWALSRLHRSGRVLAGDLCGAHSPACYVRWTQRMNARLDHPKLQLATLADAQRHNARALAMLWPALTGTIYRRSLAI